MGSQLTKQFKERIKANQSNIAKIKSESFKTSYISNNTKVVTVQVSQNNIVNVIVKGRIRANEVVEQIKDLASVSGIIPVKGKISLSQFTDCCYDLLFTKQENNNGITQLYFQTI